MKKILSIHILINISLIAMFFPVLISSAQASLVSNYCIEEGKRLYEQGNRAEAIHQFSRALMVDGSGLEALAYLQKMGVDTQRFPGYRSPSVEIATLAQAVEVYKDKLGELEDKNLQQELRCDELEENNRILCEEFKKSSAANNLLKVKLGLAKEAKQQQALVDKTKIGQLETQTQDQERQLELAQRISKKHINLLDQTEDLVDDKQKQIEELSQGIQLVKNSTLNEIISYEQKIAGATDGYNQEIRNLKEELMKAKEAHAQDSRKKNVQINRFKNLAADQGNTIQALEGSLADKDVQFNEQLALLKTSFKADAGASVQLQRKSELLKKKDKYIAQLKERLANIVKEVNALQKNTRGATAQEVWGLQGQLQDIQQELSRKDASLQEKNQELNILQDRLNDAKERLGFVEEVVDDRDNEIKELQEELIKMREQCVK